MLNDLRYTVFDTRTLQSTVYFPELCFLQFSAAQVLVGLRKQCINSNVFPTWACAAGCNSGRTGSALAWDSDGRAFATQWLQQVLRFVLWPAFAPCNIWSSGGNPCVGWG